MQPMTSPTVLVGLEEVLRAQGANRPGVEDSDIQRPHVYTAAGCRDTRVRLVTDASSWTGDAGISW